MDNELKDVAQEDIRVNLTRTIDFKRRRITNAAPAVHSHDYVIRKELDDEVENLLGVIVGTATQDTDILNAVSSLSLKKQSDNATIAGNAFEVDFQLPATNLKTYDGFTIVLHDSNTLPSNTTFDTGTAGELEEGINRLTDTSKSFGSLVGKQIMVFSNKRSGSPTYDGEGTLFIAAITSNTSTVITFELPYDQPYRLVGLSYHIMTPSAGNYWYEKVKYYTPFIEDRYGPDVRKVRFDGGTATMYAWVILHNYWGFGRVGSPASATFSGVSTTEIKLLAVDNGRIASLAVTFDKINVSQLSAISADIGTVTAGTITGATVQTAASGARSVIDSSNGYRAFDSTPTLRTQIANGGGFAGDIQTTVVAGISNALTLQSNDGNAKIFVIGTTGGPVVNIQVSGANRFSVSASAITATGGAVFTGNGSAITNIDAGNISSGSLSDSRLSGNVLLTSSNLNASNLASGTVNTARLPTDVVKYGGSAIVGNISVSDGYGVAGPNSSIALASSVQLYIGATLVLDVDTGGADLNIAGHYGTLGYDTVDLGFGSKKYVYIS